MYYMDYYSFTNPEWWKAQLANAQWTLYPRTKWSYVNHRSGKVCQPKKKPTS